MSFGATAREANCSAAKIITAQIAYSHHCGSFRFCRGSTFGSMRAPKASQGAADAPFHLKGSGVQRVCHPRTAQRASRGNSTLEADDHRAIDFIAGNEGRPPLQGAST